MRLDVGEAAVEQALGALDRELLGDVDVLAAAIIAFARVAFRILVGQHRALRLEHGPADDVLAGDQLDLMLLAAELGPDRGRELGVDLGQRRPEKARPALLGRLRRCPLAHHRARHSRTLPRSATMPLPAATGAKPTLFARSHASDQRQLQFPARPHRRFAQCAWAWTARGPPPRNSIVRFPVSNACTPWRHALPRQRRLTAALAGR